MAGGQQNKQVTLSYPLKRGAAQSDYKEKQGMGRQDINSVTGEKKEGIVVVYATIPVEVAVSETSVDVFPGTLGMVC